MSFQPCEPGGTQVTLWEGVCVCVCVCARAQVTTSNYDPSCVKADTGAHVCVHLRSSALYNTHTHTHIHTSCPDDGQPRVWVIQTAAIQWFRTGRDLSQDDL